MQPSDTPTSWYELLAFVRRYLGLIVSFVVVGLLLALVWTASRPTIYSATASVLVSPVPSFVTSSAAGPAPGSVTLDTDAALVQAAAVARSVGEAVIGDPRTTAERLSVTAAPLTRVLRITYRAPTASEAARAANTAASQFIELRRDSLGALRTDQINELSIRIADLKEQLQARAAEPELFNRSDPLAAQVEQMSERLRELKRARRVPAQVITQATPPRSPDPVEGEVALTSGAMMGLLTATGVGSLLDRRRRHWKRQG